MEQDAKVREFFFGFACGLPLGVFVATMLVGLLW